MAISLADRTPVLAARCKAVNAKFMHLSDRLKFAVIMLFDGSTLVLVGVLVVTLPIIAVSVVTTVMSILVKFVGMPAQIRKLWNQKSAYELSFTNAVTNQLSYGCWVAFAIKSHNLTVFIAQGAGIFGSTVISTILLTFILRPPLTTFGHPRGKHCKICVEALEGMMIFFKWPAPCFGCPTGHFHVVGQNPSRVVAKCDTCCRKAYVQVTGPMCNPAWWDGLIFRVRKNRAGCKYKTVTRASYMEAERQYMRELVHAPAGDLTLRIGVPTYTAFGGDDYDGQILMPDGETSVSMWLAIEQGKLVRTAREKELQERRAAWALN